MPIDLFAMNSIVVSVKSILEFVIIASYTLLSEGSLQLLQILHGFTDHCVRLFYWSYTYLVAIHLITQKSMQFFAKLHPFCSTLILNKLPIKWWLLEST